jgi:hypothetical protein
MSKTKLLSSALVLAALFTTPAWAAGSDVAKYPRIDAPTNAIVRKHDGVGSFDPSIGFPDCARCHEPLIEAGR